MHCWRGSVVVYGIADCALHAFVKHDEQKNVQEMYWAQFEGYIPTSPVYTTNMIHFSTRR
jgi:hypothetical protein